MRFEQSGELTVAGLTGEQDRTVNSKNTGARLNMK